MSPTVSDLVRSGHLIGEVKAGLAMLERESERPEHYGLRSKFAEELRAVPEEERTEVARRWAVEVLGLPEA